MASRDVEIDILANDKTARATRSAASNFKGLDREAKKAVRGLKNIKTDDAGREIGEGLVKNISKSMAPLADAVVPILAGIGVAVAPLIGASISGAIIGGVSIGVVAAGVALASKDLRVQSAFKGLTDNLSKRMETAGASFVEPTIAGINTIKRALDTIDLEGIFRDASNFVAPLTAGIAKAMTAVGNGVKNLVANAGPVIKAISEGIGNIGTAIGDGFNSLADNGDAAAAALKNIFDIIEISIDGVFALVNGLTELYDQLRKLRDVAGVTDLFNLFGAGLDKVADGSQQAGSGVGAAATAIAKLATEGSAAGSSMETLGEKMQEAATEGRSLYDSQTSAADAIARTSRAVKENGKTLSLHSAKGRENREVLSSLAGALNREYQETLKANGAGREAERVATKNRAAFIKQAEGMGLSARAANKLADQILGIPSNRHTRVTLDKSKAQSGVNSYKSSLSGIPRLITTTVNIIQRGKSVASIVAAARGAAKSLKNSGHDTGASFSAADFVAGGTNSRLGGPSPISTYSIENVIVLDGTEIYRKVDDKIRSNNKQLRHEARVGKR